MATLADVRSRRLLAVAIFVLLGLLGFLLWMFTQVEEDQPELVAPAGNRVTWVRSIYGFGPNAEDLLQAPSSVAVAPNGDIYATDPVRSRVIVFTPAGELRHVIRSAEPGYLPGSFIRPEAVAVDESTGEVFVADSWASKILVFDTNGDYVREWPVESQARGVAVGAERVFVLGAGSVIVYSKDGGKLDEFGERGPEPGQIDAYLGIEVDDDHVFIADSYNRRIQAFDHDGTLAWARPSVASTRSSSSFDDTSTIDAENEDEDFEWDLPQDLTLDGAGRLVVADAFRFELVTADADDGAVEAAYGEFGAIDGQFYYPTSVDYDPQRDWFVVADTQNDRIQIVRIPGSSGDVLAPVRRAAASPERFLVIPIVLLIGMIVLSGYMWRRRNRLAQDGLSERR